jgi:hypothetical protein
MPLLDITMKKIRLIVAFILFAAVVLNCNLLRRPEVTDGPSFEVWTPTSQLPVETTPKILEPTLNQPVYARAQIGTYLSVWVTYDPVIWNAVTWTVSSTNLDNEPVQQLVHLTIPNCSLHDNLGHGVPTYWSWAGSTREIGQVVFQIEQWTDINTNNPVLVVYQYPAGEMTTTTRRLELETDSLPYNCIAAADMVIALSIPDLTQ